MSKSPEPGLRPRWRTDLLPLAAGLVTIYALLTITTAGVGGGPIAMLTIFGVPAGVARFATRAPRVLRLVTGLFAGTALLLALFLIWARVHGYR